MLRHIHRGSVQLATITVNESAARPKNFGATATAMIGDLFQIGHLEKFGASQIHIF
ncbi:hypothetical protein ACU8KH_01315 [Lachancea thermotolerans]